MDMIHKTAIIEPGAVIGKKCKIGPHSYIGSNVVIGDNTEIGFHTVIEGVTKIGNGNKFFNGTVIGSSHSYSSPQILIGDNNEFGNNAVVEGNTTIGSGNKFFTGAVIGSRPQDLKYKNEKSFLIIGDNNHFREYVDVNVAVGEGEKTIIGSNNLFMVYVHVAHNCVIHNNTILANCATLAGHVTLESFVRLGGLAGVHQFVKIGAYSMIGGLSKVTMDVMPYCMVDGCDEVKTYGLNVIGLQRADFSNEMIAALKKAYKVFFRLKLTKNEAVEKISNDSEINKFKEVMDFVDFAKKSERGILR
ncbi:MAG: acyl-ACP--UDP-N-acetylglucosamine O-acyltransferase [Candidatus Wallbacteria bacterium]